MAKQGGRGGQVEFLHEDRDLVIVVKPAGLPVIAPEGGRGKNLLDLVTERLRRRNPKARAAVVHRLDRDTSGLVAFATNARAKRILMDEWASRATDRRYAALVEGVMAGGSGELDSWIAEAGPSRMRVAKQGERGALRALGRWELLRAGRDFSLIEVSLETGRKHQIRVQLAALGHPVAGDSRYGARSDPAARLMLHASVLEIVHPVTDERLRFESQPPDCFYARLRPR
jgi:RluA family pseudouridine synthase